MSSKVYLLPVAVFMLFQFTFIGTYIAAILQGHVVPAVPYISDAATYSPESCVFGQLINIGAVLLGTTIYIRYGQVLEINAYHPQIGVQSLKYNKIGLYFGLASCLGISIVANFQETNVRIVHFIGAFCCFGFGTLYFWIQAYLSFLMIEFLGSKRKAQLRLGMAIICTVLFVIASVTGLISHILFKGQDPRKWYPSDGGWQYHVASSISEWVIATVFSFYILSFTDEFRYVHYQVSVLHIYSMLEDTQNGDGQSNESHSEDAPNLPAQLI